MGVDHLLFVLGLMLIVRDRWMLLKTITSFTVAHSITLAVATLGYVSAPLPPLNVAIALSIFFLGPEIVRRQRGQTSLTLRHPWLVAAAFGLLHGFGFASGLTALGLSRAEIPEALLLFNVGVEIGQVFFVLLIILLEQSFQTLEIRWPRLVAALPSYTVGGLGAFWTIQRTVMLIGGASMKRVRFSARDVSWLLIIASILFWTSLAEAHPQQGQAAGFITGFLHPWSGADHILAMIAVGIWGAQLGTPAIWLLPVTFPMVMAFGGFLGLIGVRCQGIEFGIALSALLLGAAVCAQARPKLIFAHNPGWVLWSLPRSCSRHRASPGAEWTALQHGICDRDRLSTCHRYLTGPGQSMADRKGHLTYRRSFHRFDGCLFRVGSNGMKESGRAIRLLASVGGLAMMLYPTMRKRTWSRPAWGPFTTASAISH